MNTEDIQKLHNSIACQHVEGVTVPYALIQYKSNTIEFELSNGITGMFLHTDIPFVSAHETLIVKQMQNLLNTNCEYNVFENGVKREYYWNNLSTIIGVDSENIHVQTDLKYISNRSLAEFLYSTHKAENVIETFKTLMSEMKRIEIDLQRQ